MRGKQNPRRHQGDPPPEPHPADIAAILGPVVDASPMAMAATSGTDHLVRHANPAFCRLVGREWNVVVGHSLAASLPKTRRARTSTLLDRVYSTGVAERTGNLGLADDGQDSALWASTTWPILGDNQHPTGLLLQLSATTDHTRAPDRAADLAIEVREANRRLLVAGLEAQQQADNESAINAELRESTEALQASERRYWRRAAELQATIDAIEDGVAVLDDAGAVTVMNDALIRTLGHPVATEADLGRALSGADLHPGAEPSRLQLRPDGRWLEIRTFRADDAHPDDAPSRVVMIRDITQERADRDAREAFVGVLSHELRTPVTTILGMSRLLGRATIEGDARTRRELIGDVAAEAERLDRLVEDLLVLSRTERGQLIVEPEPVLLQHVIREAVAAEASRFPLVNFVADIQSLPPVSADRTYVTQVVRNLLSNAGKYGPDGPCEVKVLADRDGDDIVVQVLDEGTNFPTADRDRLFDLFFRASAPSRLKPGAGIGLYVTRVLVEAMDGRVWAAEREGGGSAFGFTLPIMAVAREPESA